MDHFSIHRLEKTCTHYGIDAPCILGFLCGVTLMLFSSPLIKSVIDKHVAATLKKENLDGESGIHKIFDWPGAGLIGMLERVL
jgi:hypothetical protein